MYFDRSAGSRLPPLTMATTGRRSWRTRCSAAATVAAPLGSATILALHEQPADRGGDLAVVDGVDPIDELPHVREVEIAGTRGHQSVGDAAGSFERPHFAGFDRSLHRRGARGLDADDAELPDATA